MEADKNPLSAVPCVQISPEGIFKYILIKAIVEDKGQNQNLIFVRGSAKREYHAENFKDFIKEVQKAGFKISNKNADKGTFNAEKGDCKISFSCPGGGRIEHNYKGKKCFIYGYSQSYGSVDHTIAKTLISEHLKYPEIQITTSQEGY